MTKRTLQPKIRRYARVHGFRARMASATGRRVLKARRAKGRWQLTVSEINTRSKRVDWNATKSGASARKK